MKILIDNGHGHNTSGKRSPDGKFREYAYNREIAKRIVADLIDRGHDAELIVPEDNDISLEERVRRANKICLASDPSCVILVSIHVNAAGNGSKWTNATGWSVYTCKGQTSSDKLAECLCEAAIKNFYILRHSLCPAVLTENFFMDNKSDLEYLQSKAGKQAVVDTHIEGIIEYLDSLSL